MPARNDDHADRADQGDKGAQGSKSSKVSTGGALSLDEIRPRLEALAQEQGLDYFPVDFELVPDTFMMEVAVYGLPVRMPHWSFGVRYIYQYVQHRMGGSRIFEVVFPGRPNRAYLQSSNSLSDNALVIAHVLGHADFSKNNELFARMQREAGYQIVEQAAARAHRIEDAIRAHGDARVERVLDAALALEQCIDVNLPLHRERYPEKREAPARPPPSDFEARFSALPGEQASEEPVETPSALPVPPYPEPDLLWFIAHYAPDMAPWERDIFLAVREESYYFYPVSACHIMNEGWASFWHARLLREADFLPGSLYLDAIKAHSDVVRPFAGPGSVALSVNPYHLGFHIWERIVEKHGLEKAFRIRAEEDDFSFVRNYLDEDLADELGLFVHLGAKSAKGEQRYRVEDADIHELREVVLAGRFNYGAPRVRVSSLAADGSLTLMHEAEVDGRGLDLERARKVLDYIQKIWHRPVKLETTDSSGRLQVLVSSGEVVSPEETRS